MLLRTFSREAESVSRSSCYRLLAATLGLTLWVARAAPEPPPAAPPSSLKATLETVLTRQQAAWNQGDVVAFMEGYWNSPELTFAGSSGITRGYAGVLAHYQQSYRNRSAMGHLDFTDLEVHPLGQSAALVLGKWHLTRPDGDVGGVFSLVFQKFPEGWKIVHDHTSVVAAKP